jgi:uracil-DNA glycosylase
MAMSALSADSPVVTSLTALRKAEDACRRCPLYADATQAVPGEGSRDAEVMLVGEQPGDKEDLAGKPFVGPPGGSSIRRWPRPASTATRPSSPTR